MDQSGEMSGGEMSAIRNQMDETRTALAEKIELLEKQVTNTVQGAAQSVGDTVESVKHAVEDTVNSVKTSVQDGMHAVGEALSLQHHVERHPWPMMAGAVAVGFVGGYMLFARSENQRAEDKFRRLASSQGRPPEQQYGAYPQPAPMPQAEAVPRRVSNGSMKGMRSSTSSNAFQEWLKPASQQLQSLAIGAALGVLRDMLSKAVPKPIEGQVTEMVDGLTSSLGGQVIRGSLLEQFEHQRQN
jgi:ElaB/YqjD/DUF883 family membrane-anchored ribosome-binding protein